MEKDEDIHLLLLERIKEGKYLLKKLTDFSGVNGISKLERRILAELRFLHKLQSSNKLLKKEHILSSNLQSLAGIIKTLEKCDSPASVLQPFPLNNVEESRLEIDIVSHGGAVWHKVIARKAEALNDICKGKVSYGQKSLIDQAKQYLTCANQHPHLFKPPQVLFSFSSGVGKTLALKLQKMGIQISGQVIDLQPESDGDSSSDGSEEDCIPLKSVSSSSQNKLFLDITSMVAYVSSMTNGGANFKFPKPIFNQQAEWERERPAKMKLDEVFQNRELVTCQTAFKDFNSLVNIMGGPGEKERTRNLIERLQVLPDCPSQRIRDLKLSSNIKERSRIIFGTADQLQAVVVTANTGFVRSAASQGVTIAVHFHEPRVLTEMQEKFSVPL